MQLTQMMIYGGGAWSYAHDANFTHVSRSIEFWEDVIEAYYSKYHGIRKGHDKDILFAKENGYLETPSGRFFKFNAEWNGREWKWPLTLIKNYPIQSFGADLVMLARIEAFRLFRESGMEGFFIQTIHDSLVYDVPEKNVIETAKILKESIAKVHELCYTNWNYRLFMPLKSELSVGMNKKDMKIIQV